MRVHDFQLTLACFHIATSRLPKLAENYRHRGRSLSLYHPQYPFFYLEDGTIFRLMLIYDS